MAHNTNDQQVQQANNSTDNPPNTEKNNTDDEQEDKTTDPQMKKAKLSRESTLESIREEDNTSLDERLLLESFKSITDIFENEGKEEETGSFGAEANQNGSVRSFSEDTDSLDEEVRRIMSQDEDKKKQSTIGSTSKIHLEPKDAVEKKPSVTMSVEEFEEESESETEADEETESVPSETESESESDEPTTETDADEGNETDKSTTGWNLHDKDHDDEESEHSDEEFDMDKYLDKLCLQSTDTGSTDDESDTDSTCSDEGNKFGTVMRKRSKTDTIETDDDSRSESDDSENEDEDSASNPDPDRDYEYIDGKFEDDAGVQEKGSDEDSDDESSDMSSGESDDDFSLDDVDDSVSVSSDDSLNDDFDFDDREGPNPETSQLLADELQSAEPANQPHHAVRKCYSGLKKDKCPEKIDVNEGEIGRLPMHSTLSSPNVLSLRWPFTNYYVKEFDLVDKNPIYDDNDLLPSYKSMQSSASFPGRRRNVMQGRVWWVEWWASSALTDSDTKKDEKSDDDWEDIEQSEQFEPEMKHS